MDIVLTLGDEMTLGQLRALAGALGQRVVLTIEDGASVARRAQPRKQKASEPPTKRRRKLSPKARAALARNLVKARAARAAKAKMK